MSAVSGNTVVVGGYGGDEGKGKVVGDIIRIGNFEYVVKFNGGRNSGHTTTIECVEVVYHGLPAGCRYPHMKAVIGNGAVVDVPSLVREIEETGMDTGRLYISDRAHITLPTEMEIERILENRKGSRIGTTNKAIGPTYAMKALRLGLRVVDLLDENNFRRKLQGHFDALYDLGIKLDGVDFERTYTDQLAAFEVLRSRVTNVAHLLAQAKGDILFEGSQGTILDIDHGTYPYVSSSNGTAGGACTGSGVGPTEIENVVLILKAYPTRVGDGPFLTRMDPELEEKIREKAHEFGATSGRPRECGHVDAVAEKYAIEVSRPTHLCITRLDILDGMPDLNVCIAYRDKRTGKLREDFPADLADADGNANYEPVWGETLIGWDGITKGASDFEKLADAGASPWVEGRETALRRKIDMISTGPEYGEFVVRE